MLRFSMWHGVASSGTCHLVHSEKCYNLVEFHLEVLVRCQINMGAEEMALRLRAPADLPEDSGSTGSTT